MQKIIVESDFATKKDLEAQSSLPGDKPARGQSLAYGEV